MKSEVEELLKACEPHREQFDMAVHSRELENIIAFSYSREYLTGKAACLICDCASFTIMHSDVSRVF